MNDVFEFSDELGPTKIIHVYEPKIDLKAILVIDNVAKGPSIGGVRMAQDVSLQECVRLARAMTLKNAAAGLPHGGGKAVLFGNPKMSKTKKEILIRGMANSLRDIREYIFAPDMGTDEECMAWVKDEIDRVVGLPRELGGIPLDEIGATGWGLSHVTDVALGYCDFTIKDARLVIQGFGAVGQHTARFLTQKGARLIAAADSAGAIENKDGLDVNALIELKNNGHSVINYKQGKKLNKDEIIDVECDIWIPAARPDVIHEDNVHRLKTKLVIEGANIPLTHAAEKLLYEKGILYIPDFIANAGGVICAAMEYQHSSKQTAFETIEEKLRRNTQQILETCKQNFCLPREAAIEMALQRIKTAMGFHRWNLF